MEVEKEKLKIGLLNKNYIMQYIYWSDKIFSYNSMVPCSTPLFTHSNVLQCHP